MTTRSSADLRARDTRRFMPFRTPVRGHVFAPRPPGTDPPRPGQEARLRREPDNPRDPWAIAVWVPAPSGPWRIGYLERAVAARLAPRLDVGGLAVDARVEGWQDEPGGRWRRPVVVLEPRVDDVGGAGGGAPRGPVAARDVRGHWGEPPRSVVRAVRRRERRRG